MLSLAALCEASRIAKRPHTCPKCLGSMILMRVRPARLGFEMHTFQGRNCNHVDKVVKATHSMDWMTSGLRAPV
jgi:hypothetical protein